MIRACPQPRQARPKENGRDWKPLRRHLRVDGLRQGSAVLDRFVGQVRAIGRNENVRVHNRTPLYAFESGSTVQGAIALAIDAAETGQAYWVTAALARDSVVGSLDVSFTADVFPQSSTIS